MEAFLCLLVFLFDRANTAAMWIFIGVALLNSCFSGIFYYALWGVSSVSQHSYVASGRKLISRNPAKTNKHHNNNTLLNRQRPVPTKYTAYQAKLYLYQIKNWPGESLTGPIGMDAVKKDNAIQQSIINYPLKNYQLSKANGNHFFIDLQHQALQHFAGANFCKMSSTICYHGLHALCPPNGAG